MYISLGLTSHHECGIFSANLRKFYWVVYENKGMWLMIDRSLTALGGLPALAWGWDGCDSLHAFRTFLFCPSSFKKIKVKGTDQCKA